MRLIMADSKELSRRRYLALVGAATALSGAPAPQPVPGDADRERRMKWWHDARFGMFIHWGLYSVVGRHEWVMENEAIPVAEYEQLA
jgi:alpha-L-fucosidase